MGGWRAEGEERKIEECEPALWGSGQTRQDGIYREKRRGESKVVLYLTSTFQHVCACLCVSVCERMCVYMCVCELSLQQAHTYILSLFIRFVTDRLRVGEVLQYRLLLRFTALFPIHTYTGRNKLSPSHSLRCELHEFPCSVCELCSMNNRSELKIATNP